MQGEISETDVGQNFIVHWVSGKSWVRRFSGVTRGGCARSLQQVWGHFPYRVEAGPANQAGLPGGRAIVSTG